MPDKCPGGGGEGGMSGLGIDGAIKSTCASARHEAREEGVILFVKPFDCLRVSQISKKRLL